MVPKIVLPMIAVAALVHRVVPAHVHEQPTPHLAVGKAPAERARAAEAWVQLTGVCTHFGYDDTVYGQYDLIKRKLLELGIAHLRDGGGRPGSDAKSTLFYQHVTELGGLGIKSTLCMDAKVGVLPTDAPAIVKASGSGVQAIEGPNEVDNAGLGYKGLDVASGIRAYMADTIAALRGDPATVNVAVVGPAMANPSANATVGSIPNLTFGNMHSYPGGHMPSTDLDTKWIPDARLTCGNAPLIATETGYHNGIGKLQTTIQPGVSELAAGKYAPRLFFEYFNRGIQRAFLYEFIDESNDTTHTNAEQNFGLLRNDFSEKPAFTAIKNTIALLRDPGPAFKPGALNYAIQGDMTNVHKTLLQKRDGSFWLALWQEVPSYNPQTRTDLSVASQSLTLTFNQPIAVVQVFKPGSGKAATSTTTAPSTFKVEVPDEVVLLRILPR